MTRKHILAVVAGATALAPSAAQHPPAFAQVQPGLWEVTGAPGISRPVRQCIADVAALGRFEHRAKACSAKVLPGADTVTEIEYSCGAAGFGHSEMTVITPRSLRISTQGISDGLPFNYRLQAHRVGDCSAALAH